MYLENVLTQNDIVTNSADQEEAQYPEPRSPGTAMEE
jgi:hypothetical protein